MSGLEEGEVPSAIPNNKKNNATIYSSSYRTKVCDHFKKGACLKGNKCSFMHPKELLNVTRICKYYLGQGCSNNQCQYSHDLSKYQCKFYFGMAFCKGQGCRFSHDMWDSEIAKQQWVNDNEQFLKDCYIKRGTTGLGLNYDEQFKNKLEQMRMHPNFIDQRMNVQPNNMQYVQYVQQQQPIQNLFKQIQPNQQNNQYNLEQISDDEQESIKAPQMEYFPPQTQYTNQAYKPMQQVPPFTYNQMYYHAGLKPQPQQIPQMPPQMPPQYFQNYALPTQPIPIIQQTTVMVQKPQQEINETKKEEPQKKKKKKIKKQKPQKTQKVRQTIRQIKERLKKQKDSVKQVQLSPEPPEQMYKQGPISQHLGIPIRKPVAQYFLGF